MCIFGAIFAGVVALGVDAVPDHADFVLRPPMLDKVPLHGVADSDYAVGVLCHGAFKVADHFGALPTASAPLSAVGMKNHGYACFIFYNQPCDAAEPVVDADDVEIVFFFLDESVDEFGGAQDVVGEDVAEEFDVGAPLFEVIGHEEGKNVAGVRD